MSFHLLLNLKSYVLNESFQRVKIRFSVLRSLVNKRIRVISAVAFFATHVNARKF